MDQHVSKRPTATDAADIVRRVLGEEPEFIQRFPTGLCHYVFDVVTKAGKQAVVRIAEPDNRHHLQGAVHWSNLLRPKGIPLPELIHADLEARTSRFPYMVLERLAGTDLNHVYAQLSVSEKQAIASQLVEVQRIVNGLPEGKRYGYATSYDDAPQSTWAEVVEASLQRSAAWIASRCMVNPAVIDRVRAAGADLKEYFANIRPVPFLDDTTTKNVIIHNGRLSGIVDVDEICFGDPLTTPALTQMSLLASGYPTDYVDFWCDALELDHAQRRAVVFYTALFCVCFLGEVGQAFNANGSATVDLQKVARLNAILDDLLASPAWT